MIAAVPVIEHPDACPQWVTWGKGEHVLVIDNSRTECWAELAAAQRWGYVSAGGRNLGVAGAWNVARSALIEAWGDYVVLFSSSVEWAEPLEEVLCRFRNAAFSVVDDMPSAEPPKAGVLTDLAWHAVMLSRQALMEAGPFDENLWPGYSCDTDYGRRLWLLGYHADGTEWPKLLFAEEGLASCIDAKALKAGVVGPVDFLAVERYMRAKWGDVGGAGDLETPFGLPVGVDWWSPYYRPGLEDT